MDQDQMPREAFVTAYRFLDFFLRTRSVLLGRGLMGFDERTWEKRDETRTGVGETDLKMQEAFMAFLPTLFPSDIIVGEEGKEFAWPPQHQHKGMTIFDPLDGSSNREDGLPTFGSMFARTQYGRLEMAGIYLPREDHSFNNGFFFAQRNYGVWQWKATAFRRVIPAQRPGRRMKIAMEGRRQKLAENPRTHRAMIAIASTLSLSSAWAAVLVALGRYDGLVALDNAPWDNLPILTFAQELGLVATDFDDNPVTLENCKSIVVAQQAAHEKIIEALKV